MDNSAEIMEMSETGFACLKRSINLATITCLVKIS